MVLKQREDQEKDGDNIKDTMQQHCLTINDATARILKTLQHQTSMKKQPLPKSGNRVKKE
jgi:hypothetical protein